MQKIVSLFQRNYETDRLVRDEVVPGAEWVLSGEGVATRKYDGTCCMIRGGKLYKRYELKANRTTPPSFEPAQPPDPVTGDVPGWLPVGDGPEDARHREAFGAGNFPDGTYELCGPKVQGNPERFETHVLVPHGIDKLPDAPRDFAHLRAYLAEKTIEGIVWHHPDGRMVKIKRRDFFKQRRTGTGLPGNAAALVGVVCLFVGCATQVRPVDRLCGDDGLCRSAVAKAPELAYPSVSQAVAAGLAWAHEQPETQRPHWREIGFAVYPAGAEFRIEVQAGDDERVRLGLRPGAVAAAHVHPMPLLRECSMDDRLAAARVPIPIYLQHERTEIQRCAPLRVAGAQ